MELKDYLTYLEKRGIDLNLSKSTGIYYSQHSYDRVIEWMVNDLPMCCGVDELGNFGINLEIEDKDDKTIKLNQSKIIKLTAQLLKELVESYKTPPTRYIKRATERKILINIIDDFILIEKAIKKSKCFRKVAEFVNSNSNNLVRTYISK